MPDQPESAAARLGRAIARARDHSPFLANALDRHADVGELLSAGDLDGALLHARRIGSAPDQPVARALRLERRALALSVAIGDLAGLLPLEQVTALLSDFADRALERAIATAINERTPGEASRGFVALALGKHGSRELNYSSDIDPILLFDPATLPTRGREEPEEAAVRIARRVVELLQARDGDGYVLRVDLRLRPAPEASGMAVPVDGAIADYEALAMPWERAALIRARAAAGDRELGERFLQTIQPFVWRRTLDFGAVGEIRDISHRIRSHHRGQQVGPGYDIKRGRGGIREIEFFAQIHQLIHGGRQPALRAPATLDALARLAEAGIIDADVSRTLRQAYRHHRTIEHRLQMVDDRQTHVLPEDRAALDNVSRLADFPDGKALISRIEGDAAKVGRIYDALERQPMDSLPAELEALCRALAGLGFPDQAAAASHINRWRSGGVPATRSSVARVSMEAMLPGFLAALGKAADPMTALTRFAGMVDRLPSALNLFRLIEARPLLGTVLADILSLAPALADELARRTALLDGLIDASAFALPPAVDMLVTDFAAKAGEDYGTQLDRVRTEVGEWRFRLGAQLVLGVQEPVAVAKAYARVAEATLVALARATIATFEAVHGRVPGSELVIVALGRLGGGALTHASDLDLIYLFTGDFLTQSDGAKPLGGTHYFNRLAQRVSAALSVPTAAGPLYAVDTRLRPSGAQGLLAVSLESFVRYEAESAWTWEHLALTRARPVFGSASAQSAVRDAIATTLRRPRDLAGLRREAIHMRAEIARHKPPAGPFDVKLVPGGLIDLEFTTHVRQLETMVGLEPSLERAIAALVAAGFLPDGLSAAEQLLTKLLVTLRLIAPGGGEPAEPARAAVARICGAFDWEALLAAYGAARHSVREAWSQIATPERE